MTANIIAVNGTGVIWPFTHCSAGSIGVKVAAFFRHGIMVDHGIHVAGTNQKSQPRTAEPHDVFAVFPVGLRYNADFVTVFLENAGNYRGTERRMVHVGVAQNINKISLLPAASLHFFSCHG